MNNENIVEKKKMNNVVKIVIVAVVAYLLVKLIPFFFIFGIGLLGDSKTDAEINGTSAIVKNGNFYIETLNNYYNSENKCYVIETKIEKKGELKKNFFSLFGDERSLNITYTLKDNEGFILGTAYVYADGVNNDNKWKLFTEYCDNGADKISSIEITEINVY